MYATTMLQTMEDVRERFVAQFNPESIILFGSRARDEAADDSDYDLHIVKETNESMTSSIS